MTLIGLLPDEAHEILRRVGWNSWWKGCPRLWTPTLLDTAVLTLGDDGTVTQVHPAYPHQELPDLHG